MSNIIDEISATRQQEIEQGLNAFTVPPLYVVLDEVISVAEYDSAFSASTTLFDKSELYVRADEDGNEIPAEQQVGDNWDHPLPVKSDNDSDSITQYNPVVKKSFHDRFVTVCFTRQAAEEFIKMEGHNLNNPRIYVFGVPRRNIQLTQIVKLMGDTQF